MTTKFHVTPQRRVDGRWTECEDHQAQRFAVIELRHRPRTGQPNRSKVITAWPTKAEALAAHATLCRKHRKRAKGAITPGARWSDVEEAVAGLPANFQRSVLKP